MDAITKNQPVYGPQGQPFCLKIRTQAGTATRWYWTEQEAMEARDVAFDAGALSVAVKGLPFRGMAAGV